MDDDRFTDLTDDERKAVAEFDALAATLTPEQIRANIQAALERDRELYEATGNGCHAWAAWQTARRQDVEVPVWVLRYLDRAAGAMVVSGWSPWTRTMMGLRANGDKTSKAAQAQTARRNLHIVEVIDALHAHDPGRKIDEIFQDVCEWHGLSWDRVRDIYYARK